MDILYLLIPLSAVLVLGIVAVFGWAVYNGQFDDVEREGQQVLAADHTDPLDGGQGLCEGASQQFAANSPNGPGSPAGGTTAARPGCGAERGN